MAWGSLGALGGTQSKTANQASLALTTIAAAEAGNVAVIIVACDNAGTVDGDEGAVTSISDSAGGNTWSKALEFAYTEAGAQAGAVCSVWYSKLTNQINSGGTITANFSNSASRDATACSAWEFSIGAGNVVTVEASNSLATNSTTLGSLDATTPNAEFLRIRAAAVEAAVAQIPYVATDGTWTIITANGTTGGGAASNMMGGGEFKISTATGAASTLSYTGTNDKDAASVYVALKEGAAPSGWGPLLGLQNNRLVVDA